MMEGFKPDNNENVERFEQWRELKESAPQEALRLLEQNELTSDVERAPVADVEQLVSQLPDIIESLSENNANRYTARALSVLLHKAQMRKKYEDAPSPQLNAA